MDDTVFNFWSLFVDLLVLLHLLLENLNLHLAQRNTDGVNDENKPILIGIVWVQLNLSKTLNCHPLQKRWIQNGCPRFIWALDIKHYKPDSKQKLDEEHVAWKFEVSQVHHDLIPAQSESIFVRLFIDAHQPPKTAVLFGVEQQFIEISPPIFFYLRLKEYIFRIFRATTLKLINERLFGWVFSWSSLKLCVALSILTFIFF